MAAAAVEFALEGLYLTRRISQGRPRRHRRSTARPDQAGDPRPLRRLPRRSRSAGAAVRRRRGALDELGDHVLAGAGSAPALRDLLRRGTDGRRGLDELLRKARAAASRAARSRGRLDGTLAGGPRAARPGARGRTATRCSPTPPTTRGLREAELDALPDDTARAVQQLDDYQWRSDEARADVRADPRAAAAGGARRAVPRDEAGAGRRGDPEAMQRVKDMMSDLNGMLEADTRGEHTQARLRRVHGAVRRVLPRRPREPRGADRVAGPTGGRGRTADGLAHARAARRAAGADGAGLRRRPRPADAAVAARSSLRDRRPDLFASRPARMRGDQGMGMGRGNLGAGGDSPTSRLSKRCSARTTPVPRSTTSTKSSCASARPAGRRRPRRACERMERELERAGLPHARRRRASSSPPRPCAGSARPRCAGCSRRWRPRPRGDHDIRDAGAAGRAHRRLARLAVRRRAAARRRAHGAATRSARRRSRRRQVTPRRRRLRGARDRTPYPRRGLPARRPVVLDGAQRHLARGQDDRAGAARAGRRRSSRRTPSRSSASPTWRAWCRPPSSPSLDVPGLPGHQPAARADARRPLPRQAPRRRAGGPGGHRRRADRAPRARRRVDVQLAAVAPRRSPSRWPRSTA